MKCDSCGGEASALSNQDIVRWNVGLSWPPTSRTRKTENWCLACAQGVDSAAADLSRGGSGGRGI